MADFARMPTRQKVMVFAVIGILLGLLYWQFVFKGLKEDIASAENENASQSQLSQKLEKDIPEYQKLKTRMNTLQKVIDENQKALPTEAELPAFFETLNRKVLESGVEVVRSRQGKEQKVETFVKVPIEYEIQGSFLQIKKFFASLLPKKEKPESDPNSVEERERIVSIENLSLSNPVVRNREIRLTAKFTASTFRQEEATSTAKPAAKAATPATKAPAAPAQAPAATPAGARQRTDSALDKADQRASGAATVDEAKPAGTDRMKGGL